MNNKKNTTPGTQNTAPPTKVPLPPEDKRIKEMKDSIRREFGNRLTKVREERRLSQPEMMRQFTETVKKDVSSYSRWENGLRSPDLEFLCQLHQKWNVDLNWLIAGDEQYAPSVPEEVLSAIRVLEGFKRDCIFGKKTCQDHTVKK